MWEFATNMSEVLGGLLLLTWAVSGYGQTGSSSGPVASSSTVRSYMESTMRFPAGKYLPQRWHRPVSRGRYGRGTLVKGCETVVR